MLSCVLDFFFFFDFFNFRGLFTFFNIHVHIPNVFDAWRVRLYQSCLIVKQLYIHLTKSIALPQFFLCFRDLVARLN